MKHSLSLYSSTNIPTFCFVLLPLIENSAIQSSARIINYRLLTKLREGIVFSHVSLSVILSHVSITHYAKTRFLYFIVQSPHYSLPTLEPAPAPLDMGPHCTSPSPFLAWNLTVQGLPWPKSPGASSLIVTSGGGGNGISLYSNPPTSTDIGWPRLVTCSNLFT